jgi:acetyltransferase-like isoleucine patch superfamily enzyme
MRRQVKPDRFAAFGNNSVIVPPAVIVNHHRISIGDDVMINDRVWMSVVEHYRGQDFEPSLTIGDRTKLGRDNYIACVGRVEIGNDVLGGVRVLIADTYHEYQDPDTAIAYQPMAEPQPVRIGDGVLLNVNVAILPGVTVGERSYIGAGAVVTRDVPPNSVVVGNPARVIRRYDHERSEWVDADQLVGH